MIHCIKCETNKPESEYYRSSIRASGKGECKDCTKARVTANRNANLEYYQEFDRKRANLPHRVKARKEYVQTENGRKSMTKGNGAWRKRNPSIARAHRMVSKAVRDGILIKPSNCEGCDSEAALHGHHCDYNKPLDVMWLCEPCHKQWHRDNTPIYCGELE